MILHLGVIDVPYTTHHQKVKPKSPNHRKRPKEVFVWTKAGWVTSTLGKIGQKPYKGPSPGPKGSTGMPTTGDVAVWLENKYHIMESFYELRKVAVIKDLQESVQGKLEDIMMGAPVDGSPFLQGTSAIADSFKKFLSSSEIEGLGIPGVPTQAALDGVNHRLKSGKGPRRPSFIDTGLYQASFIAWVD